MPQTKPLTLQEAEAAYERASELDTELGTDQSLRDQEAAWDAYVDLCNDVDKCHQPGCEVIDHQHAWCEEHRG